VAMENHLEVDVLKGKHRENAMDFPLPCLMTGG
jgi:hypothetical protein